MPLHAIRRGLLLHALSGSPHSVSQRRRQRRRRRAVSSAFRPSEANDSPQAKWQATRYHEDYRRVGGEWKIAHLRIKGPGMSVDYAEGWAERLYR